MARFPSIEQINYQIREEKKQHVMRLVEAIIAAAVTTWILRRQSM